VVRVPVGELSEFAAMLAVGIVLGLSSEFAAMLVIRVAVVGRAVGVVAAISSEATGVVAVGRVVGVVAAISSEATGVAAVVVGGFSTVVSCLPFGSEFALVPAGVAAAGVSAKGSPDEPAVRLVI
jgi:hypothetical protein